MPYFVSVCKLNDETIVMSDVHILFGRLSGEYGLIERAQLGDSITETATSAVGQREAIPPP